MASVCPANDRASEHAGKLAFMLVSSIRKTLFKRPKIESCVNCRSPVVCR